MKTDKTTAEKGFTLLELIVVIAVLALITSLATEYVVKETNQQRYATTKKRVGQIRYALIGDSSRVLNNQPAFSGYISDTGLKPKYLRDLLSNKYCTDVRYRTIDACTNAGFEWREAENWKGPYLQPTSYKDIYGDNSEIIASIPVFRDAWGNRSKNTVSETDSMDNLNFGWIYTVKQDTGISISSLGLNGSENDNPTSSKYMYEKDMGSHIHNNQIKGSNINLTVINDSGQPDSRFCIDATYRNGNHTRIDLASQNQIPAAEIFGNVTINGLIKGSSQLTCKNAVPYPGIEKTEYFAHNLFNTKGIDLVIK